MKIVDLVHYALTTFTLKKNPMLNIHKIENGLIFLISREWLNEESIRLNSPVSLVN